ncbi:MAG: hypothetical protein ABI180_13190 [Microcoleus sp.]
MDLKQNSIARNSTNHIISAEKPQCRLLATRTPRPKPQSAPAVPRTAEARYNLKSIGLALRVREC